MKNKIKIFIFLCTTYNCYGADTPSQNITVKTGTCRKEAFVVPVVVTMLAGVAFGTFWYLTKASNNVNGNN